MSFRKLQTLLIVLLFSSLANASEIGYSYGFYDPDQAFNLPMTSVKYRDFVNPTNNLDPKFSRRYVKVNDTQRGWPYYLLDNLPHPRHNSQCLDTFVSIIRNKNAKAAEMKDLFQDLYPDIDLKNLNVYYHFGHYTKYLGDPPYRPKHRIQIFITDHTGVKFEVKSENGISCDFDSVMDRYIEHLIVLQNKASASEEVLTTE